MRDAYLRTVNSVESALENINGVVENFGKCTHGGLTPTVGLGLTPYFAYDNGVEIPVELSLCLLVEYFGELLFSE